MEPISKKLLLEKLEAQTEAHLEEVISLFQNLSEDVLLRPSKTGGWSIAQCLEHLNSYGNYYLPQIIQGIEKNKGEGTDFFKSSWIGAYFTRLMDPKTGKGKFKAFKGHQPPASLDPHAVIAEFIHQQETLLLVLRQAQRVDLNRIHIPISIMKWFRLKLGDVFQFLIAHNERHVQQAKRNLN